MFLFYFVEYKKEIYKRSEKAI